MKIKRALLSVSDKTGIAEFARRLNGLGVEIISTGGTAALLKSESIPVVEIEKFTGFPEILGGRVKTLHPKVHGGLLYVRTDPIHQEQIAQEQYSTDRFGGGKPLSLRANDQKAGHQT